MRTSNSEVGQQAVGRTWWKITLIVAAYVEPDGARQQPTGSLYFDVARPLSTVSPPQTHREKYTH